MTVQPKMKIDILAGNPPHLCQINSFLEITKNNHVTLLLFDDNHLDERSLEAFNVKIIQKDDPNMSYIFEVEKHLHYCDAVITFECSPMLSYHARKFSRKFNIPLFTYSSKTSFMNYKAHKELLTNQKELILQSDYFLVPNKKSQTNLIESGVIESKIIHLKEVICPITSTRLYERRQKFKDYIGFYNEDIIITIDILSNDCFFSTEIINLLKKIENTKAHIFRKLKIIFIDPKQSHTEFKYQCATAGLSKQCYFIHQNTERYIDYLYCSSDFYIIDSPSINDNTPENDSILKDIISCGSIPIITENTTCESIILDSSIVLDKVNSENLFNHLEKYLLDTSLIEEKRQSTYESIIELNKQSKDPLTIINKYMHKDQLDDDFTNINKRIDSIKNIDEKIYFIEDILKRFKLYDMQKELLYNALGILYFQLSNYERSVSAFQFVISSNPNNEDALIGLGDIARTSQSYDEAIIFYKKSVSINPLSEKALLGLSIVYSNYHLYNECFYWLERCVYANINMSTLTATCITQICLECKDIDLAISFLYKVENILEDENPQIRKCLNTLHLKFQKPTT